MREMALLSHIRTRGLLPQHQNPRPDRCLLLRRSLQHLQRSLQHQHKSRWLCSLWRWLLWERILWRSRSVPTLATVSVRSGTSPRSNIPQTVTLQICTLCHPSSEVVDSLVGPCSLPRHSPYILCPLVWQDRVGEGKEVHL